MDSPKVNIILIFKMLPIQQTMLYNYSLFEISTKALTGKVPKSLIFGETA